MVQYSIHHLQFTLHSTVMFKVYYHINIFQYSDVVSMLLIHHKNAN